MAFAGGSRIVADRDDAPQTGIGYRNLRIGREPILPLMILPGPGLAFLPSDVGDVLVPLGEGSTPFRI